MFGATLGIVAQGLEILRKSVDIRNRNILNAHNPDYAQEEPAISSFVPAGIKLEDILRMQNFHHMTMRNHKLSLVSYLNTLVENNTQLESLFQEFTQGLGGSEYINRFFTAYQNLMREPTNEGAKGELLNSAQSLVSYLKSRKADMDRMQKSITYEIRQHIGRINAISKKLAQINEEILLGYGQTYARGRDYKNLLDERDRYLRELSELVRVRLQEDDIGRVRVELEGAFVLVEERHSWELRYDAGTGRVLWRSKDGSEIDVGNYLVGGKVAGLLELQRQLQGYTGRLESIAQNLISNLKLPLQGTSQWYWFRHVQDPNAPLGFSGNITFQFAGGPLTLSYTAGDSLNDLISTINTHPLLSAQFVASLVANPDGTYTMRVQALAPSNSMEDSNNLLHRSEPFFVGTGVDNMALNPAISTYMNSLDYTKADEFMDFSRSWWESSKGVYRGLVEELASRQRELRNRQEIERALLSSLNARLQEMQGVSIDQEFIELMKLQRSYEALARTVRALDELLQTTINMV